MKYSVICIIIGSILWWSPSLMAQENTTPTSHEFELFELPGNELGNHVQVIAQDSFGFMWFGSQNGLHRWDGYQFITYKHDPKDSTTITSNYVETIHVSKDGTLWIGTWGRGLDRFDYLSQTFKHYSNHPTYPSETGVSFISDIEEDSTGDIWVATHQGLLRINPKTDQIKHYSEDNDLETSLSYNSCRVLYCDKKGVLWIGTGYSWEVGDSGGLNRYQPETDDFEVFLKDDLNPYSLTTNKISSLYEDSKGNFWVGTSNGGLHRMDRENDSFLSIEQDSSIYSKFEPPFQGNSSERNVKVILEDQENRLWIGGWEGGVRYLEPQTGYTRAYFHKKTEPKSPPELSIWTIVQSKDGTLWGSTAGINARVFKIKETVFDDYPLIGNAATASLMETNDHQIIIGTSSEGLQVFDLEDLQIKKLNGFFMDATKNAKAFAKLESQNIHIKDILSSPIIEVVEDSAGWFWLRTQMQKVIVRVNSLSGAVQAYAFSETDPHSLGSGYVYDIYKDNSQKIWVITGGGDLNLFRPESRDFQRFPILDESLYKPQMLESSSGLFYIAGTLQLGGNERLLLKTFDPVSKVMKDIPGELDTIMFNQTVNNILEAPNGYIWVNTQDQVYKIDQEEGVIDTYNAFHYGSKNLKGMVIDDLGRFWLMSENLVLYDFDQGNKLFFNAYTQIKELSKYSGTIIKDHQGIIYIGGASGFLRFDPKSIGFSHPVDPLEALITDFQLLNTEEAEVPFLFQPKLDKVKLSYDQNDFELRFAALSFDVPETNRHQFWLEGYDENWRQSGIEPRVTYIKVPPGKYTFHIRGAGEFGEWGAEETIQIHITPPWWQTNMAYVTWGLLLCSLLYAGYRFQLNRRLEKAEALRLKELDVVKTKLYTNITHEFRTPLTVISGMASQIREEPGQWFNQGLDMIERNSQRLLDLVNQMLDLNKLESGQLQLSLGQNDMVSFLKYIVDSIHSLAENRNIQVHFYAEEEELWMDYDADKIQQIITNLLTNAIKFSPEGGHIYLTTKVVGSVNETSGKETTNQLQIILRDTGVGIPESQLPFIFDRFYQVDDTSTRRADGSGIGLALVKELVELMRGSITVKSKESKGTAFYLLLPIEQTQELQGKVQMLDKPIGLITQDEDSLQEVIAGSVSKARTDLPQVLIIEDHSDVVAYIAACLQNTYRILVAKDGAEGIEMALEHIPDLIITDVMMPYKNGFEVCQVLKNEERSSHIPIIMLTAKADIESKLEGFNQGADAYLAKPFDKKELLVRIKNLLQIRQKLQAYYRGLGLPIDSEEIKNSTQQLPNIEDVFVKKVNQIIETHLDDFDFDVETLSKAVHLSHSQLHRKLSALTGLSANRYIRHIRLHRAKVLLKDPEISITAVAFDTGFSDPSYFGRVFKKAFQQTPKEFQAAQS